MKTKTLRQAELVIRKMTKDVACVLRDHEMYLNGDTEPDRHNLEASQAVLNDALEAAKNYFKK